MVTDIDELKLHVTTLLKDDHGGRCIDISTASIRTLIKMLEARDPYTNGHQYNVARIGQLIVNEMNLDTELGSRVFICSLLHDLGKIGLPHEILSKPTRLTAPEYQLIQQHAELGKELLSDLVTVFPYLGPIVSQHHERIDGSGYPAMLKGDEILLEARIIGVADVIEAMTSHRPYRPALGIEKAIDEIRSGAGKIYDEAVSKAAISLYNSKKL